MSRVIISGIQQVGIGVSNMHEAWKWYRKYFGVDIRIFEEEATANLMLPYTGGKPRRRHAALAMNMQGGGGFEIWQYKDRIPEAPQKEIMLGDYGIFAVKIKSRDVKNAHRYYKEQNLNITSINTAPDGKSTFFLQDPYGNFFQITECNSWFHKNNKPTGAVYGTLMGVSDMDKSIAFYRNILDYDEIVYDKTEVFNDLANVSGGNFRYRRVLLNHSKSRMGAFSRLLGDSQMELFQVLDREASDIFRNRFWGDLGFIHLCFDINGMISLREKCQSFGHPFTVDSSNSFDMGEAAGHFSYIEDPDGTLIEFVETHKVPILKKLGWYLNLQKRNPEKSLPGWMLSALSLNRIKD
jgi:catechol 2,3-dioxygenase-like lactoylglutathione lyase family enzyme